MVSTSVQDAMAAQALSTAASTPVPTVHVARPITTSRPLMPSVPTSPGKRDNDMEIDQLRSESTASGSRAPIVPTPPGPALPVLPGAPLTPASAFLPPVPPIPDGKKSKSGPVGAILQRWTQNEMNVSKQSINAVEDALQWLDSALPYREALRVQEIMKLESFGCFQPMERRLVPLGCRVFKHLWVDTADKSRLTLQDRKSYGSTTETTNCPKPTAQTNALMEFMAIYFQVPMWCFDVVSAFPHADE